MPDIGRLAEVATVLSKAITNAKDSTPMSSPSVQRMRPSPRKPGGGKESAFSNFAKTEEQRFKTEILVSLLTLLLTPLFSGLVVSFQLTREHSFVKSREASQEREKLIEQKTRLLGEAVKLTAHINALQSLAAETSALTKLAIVLKAEKKDDPDWEKSTFDEQYQALRETVTPLLRADSELQSTLQISAFVFGPKVKTAIKNYIRPASDAHKAEEQWKLPSIEEVLKDRNLVREMNREYQERVKDVIKEMAIEVSQDLNVAPKNEP